VVVASVENLYSAPDAAKDVVTQAFLGQAVKVLDTRDGFFRIETPDRYTGWVPSDALFVYPAAETPRYAAHGRVAEVTSLMANVYRDPSVTTARPRAEAPLGARLEVVEGPTAVSPEQAARWLAVRLPDGGRGFVQKGDVRLVDAGAPVPRGSGEAVVQTARRFLGVPYLWGGLSPRGVDCSGLASRAWAVNGVQLLRDTDLQFDDPRLQPVLQADLRAGDLLYFGAKDRKVSHMGIYVADGVFIHATTHLTPAVQESRLDDPHWAALYRGARRPR
jgi:cell wall-associated NlpC family hydrolase